MNMASRMGADPIMVMQNLYMVHGRPGWSSQFLVACFNQTGRFEPIRYEFSGTEGKDDWGCTAVSKDLAAGGDELRGPKITIKIAKAEGWYGKNGSKWQTMPELMLRYRSAAWLVRTIAPELAMGLQTAEENSDAEQPSVTVVDPPKTSATSRTEALAERLTADEEAKPAKKKEGVPSIHMVLSAAILKAADIEALTKLNEELQSCADDLTAAELAELTGLMDKAAKTLPSRDL
ncbi:MAG: hypothetical protein GY903_00990 [Fuerstiella sp.]|nr:hypothetical protein [Fuerstiella sp.]MCP4853053.1 hypothetical protein [Fuerstiella sp.]